MRKHGAFIFCAPGRALFDDAGKIVPRFAIYPTGVNIQKSFVKD
jgi:hypothetical protein